MSADRVVLKNECLEADGSGSHAILHPRLGGFGIVISSIHAILPSSLRWGRGQ